MSNDTASLPLSGVHRTAIGAAAIRAAHLLRDGEPKILRDDFALRLANLTPELALQMAQMSDSMVGSAASPIWVMRSRYAEDRLAAARGRVAQYVVLGAGLDSYALRMAGRLEGLTVFEVDDPPMQTWKRARLRELAIAPPPELRFAPCDFATMSLADALHPAGYDAAKPTFVSWLGVTQYLSREAIADTLRWTAAQARGSEIVLTYVRPGADSDRTKSLFQNLGTRFDMFFTPDEMTALLTSCGLRDVEHLTLEAANAAYFGNRTDNLRAPDMERVVAAKV